MPSLRAMEGDPVLVVDRGSGEREALSLASLVALPDVIDAGTRLADRSGPALPVGAVFETDLDWVTVESGDHYRASIPTADLLSGGLLLLAGPGGPVRLVVADGTTLCWNVKHVASLRATSAKETDSVPENPPH